MRKEQDAVNRIAAALETLTMALTTYDLGPEDLERLNNLADDLDTFAGDIATKDEAQA
jgi:hypothetical protein